MFIYRTRSSDIAGLRWTYILRLILLYNVSTMNSLGLTDYTAFCASLRRHLVNELRVLKQICDIYLKGKYLKKKQNRVFIRLCVKTIRFVIDRKYIQRIKHNGFILRGHEIFIRLTLSVPTLFCYYRLIDYVWLEALIVFRLSVRFLNGCYDYRSKQLFFFFVDSSDHLKSRIDRLITRSQPWSRQ